ncbi:MAG: rhomboid family intramembrane serine protease [Roseiflexaceae bacterium]
MEPKAGDAHSQPDIPGSAPRNPAARFPIATIIILSITIVATGRQMICPELLSALRRTPDALAAGEWWRMITPLFVHSHGWVQIIVNLIGIAVVSPLVERLFGSWGWLYFTSSSA